MIFVGTHARRYISRQKFEPVLSYLTFHKLVFFLLWLTFTALEVSTDHENTEQLQKCGNMFCVYAAMINKLLWTSVMKDARARGFETSRRH